MSPRTRLQRPSQRPLDAARAIGNRRGAIDGWRTSKAANLGEWLHEPYRKGPVVAFLKAADCPVLLREVAEGCLIQLSSANRVLLRLHAAGHTTRHKLPIQRPGYCFRRKAVTPGSATRMLFVYSWVGG